MRLAGEQEPAGAAPDGDRLARVPAPTSLPISSGARSPRNSVRGADPGGSPSRLPDRRATRDRPTSCCRRRRASGSGERLPGRRISNETRPCAAHLEPSRRDRLSEGKTRPPDVARNARERHHAFDRRAAKPQPLEDRVARPGTANAVPTARTKSANASDEYPDRSTPAPGRSAPAIALDRSASEAGRRELDLRRQARGGDARAQSPAASIRSRRRARARDDRDLTVPCGRPITVAVSSSDSSRKNRQASTSRSAAGSSLDASEQGSTFLGARWLPPRGTGPRPPRTAPRPRAARARAPSWPTAAGFGPRSRRW